MSQVVLQEDDQQLDQNLITRKQIQNKQKIESYNYSLMKALQFTNIFLLLEAGRETYYAFKYYYICQEYSQALIYYIMSNILWSLVNTIVMVLICQKKLKLLNVSIILFIVIAVIRIIMLLITGYQIDQQSILNTKCIQINMLEANQMRIISEIIYILILIGWVNAARKFIIAIQIFIQLSSQKKIKWQQQIKLKINDMFQNIDSESVTLQNIFNISPIFIQPIIEGL